MCDMALGGYQGIVESAPMILPENDKKTRNIFSDPSQILPTSHPLEVKSKLNTKSELTSELGKFNFSLSSSDPTKRYIYFAKTKEVEILWFETVKV